MNNSILKLILIGDGRVGKTSIINKYINNSFNENENMTTNVSYSEKVLVYQDKNANLLQRREGGGPCI